MRPPRLITLTVCAASVLVCLAGCGKSGHSAEPSSSAKSSTVAASSTAPLTQNTLPAASAIVNNVDKRKSITITKCAAADGGWAASGTAANTGTADVSYDITVFFTNAHATVEDFATTSVTVKAGKTQPWTATKKFTATDPTNCVLRGVG